MRKVVSFDIGGTFIKYGIIDELGNLEYYNKIPTPKNNCNETILNDIKKVIKSLEKSYEISLIGISTAGKVSDDGSILFASDILPNYTGTQLKKEIEAEFAKKCEVDNDGYCAALGEMWMGVAQGYDDFILMTYGTGVGGAAVINGKLYKGANLGAMGVGHLIIDFDGRKCGCDCNMNGTYESFASTKSLLEELNISGEEFVELLREGNEVALKQYKDYITYVTYGLVNVVHILNPKLVVMGGGIMEQEFILNDIKDEFAKNVLDFYKNTHILGTKLGNKAGIYGAAYKALNSI